MCSIIPSFVHFTQALGQDLEGGISKAYRMTFVLTMFRSLLKCHPIQDAPPVYHPTQQSSLCPCHLFYFSPFPHILCFASSFIPCSNINSVKVGLSLYCSLLYPQPCEWCPVHSTHSTKTCWLNKQRETSRAGGQGQGVRRGERK